MSKNTSDTPRRGRPPGLDRDRVVAAALELVDREGLAALTMRRLGRELGVEGMALYTYVADKEDLLQAVGGLVLAELELDLPGSGSWQERIGAVVVAWVEMLRRHPNAFPLVYRQGGEREPVERTTEELLDSLRAAGFDAGGAALAYQTIVSFLDGALLAWPPAGYHAAEGWEQLVSRIDPELYPRRAEIAPHAARQSWDDVFWSGFDLFLDGLEARLRRG